MTSGLRELLLALISQRDNIQLNQAVLVAGEWVSVSKAAERILEGIDAITVHALKNSGADINCGACMEVAFTGMTQASHSCRAVSGKPSRPRRTVASR